MEESDEVLLAVFYPSDMGYDIMYYILYPINTKYISLGLSIATDKLQINITKFDFMVFSRGKTLLLASAHNFYLYT
jgi:hypothetical protein